MAVMQPYMSALPVALYCDSGFIEDLRSWYKNCLNIVVGITDFISGRESIYLEALINHSIKLKSYFMEIL